MKYSRMLSAAFEAVLIALLTGCSKTETGGSIAGAGLVMTIEPEVEGASKAALINDATDLQRQGFGMSVYNGNSLIYNDLTMEYDDGWEPESGDELKWPGNTSYKFCAWSPADMKYIITTTGDGFSSFTYSGIADQTDIMLGYYEGKGTTSGEYCAAPIKFSHPLASVQFQVGTMIGLSAIDSISISGVMSQGTCTVTTAYPPTYSWSDITGTAVSLTQSGLTVNPTSGSAIGDPFLVLPQALATNNITVTLHVTMTSGSGKDLSFILDSGSLIPGKTTKCTVNYLATSFTISVDDWISNDEDTFAVGPEPKYVVIPAKYDGESVTDLKWYRQNLAITESGNKKWKGKLETPVKVPGMYEDVIVGDYFQWAAYAGYCGDGADADKGLLIYTEFTNQYCDSETSNAFTFKSGKSFIADCSPYYDSSSGTWSKYCPEPANLEATDDVANIILGGDWRIPTVAEFQAMIDATYWAYDKNDCGFYVFTPDDSHQAGGKRSNTNGLSKEGALLFFPLAGKGSGTKIVLDNTGYYWSNECTETSGKASLYKFKSSTSINEATADVYVGCSVRPVSK